MRLFGEPWSRPEDVSLFLAAHHYLGPTKRGLAYQDEAGVIVIANPTTRRLPSEWRELTRWCIVSDQLNAGSRQWGRFIRTLRLKQPSVTTLVSYSDPSVGHDGALYRACNWWWAPTWHRLRPPPSGNGSWREGRGESVKDRWVFPLQPDPRRLELLKVQDASILRRFPWALYREPGGVPFHPLAPERAAA